MAALWLPTFTLKALNNMGLRVRRGERSIGRTKKGFALFTLSQLEPARQATPRAFPRDFPQTVRQSASTIQMEFKLQ